MKHQYNISLNKIKIKVPTLILFWNNSTSDVYKYGDSVLNISENIKQIPKLFDQYDLLKINFFENGVHDLLCSDGDVDDNCTTLGNVITTINKFIK